MLKARLFPSIKDRFSANNRLSRKVLTPKKWRQTTWAEEEDYERLKQLREFRFSHLLVGGTWLWIVAGLVLACILHIIAILGLPYIANQDAWSRLEPIAPLNAIITLPPGRKAQKIIPRAAPDIRYAVCRFDLTKTPLLVTTIMPNDHWSVAIYDRNGRNFYAVSGADLQRRVAKIELVEKGRQALFRKKASNNTQSDDIFTVTTPEKQGIVIIRAPIPALSESENTDATLAQSSCVPRT